MKSSYLSLLSLITLFLLTSVACRGNELQATPTSQPLKPSSPTNTSIPQLTKTPTLNPTLTPIPLNLDVNILTGLVYQTGDEEEHIQVWQMGKDGDASLLNETISPFFSPDQQYAVYMTGDETDSLSSDPYQRWRDLWLITLATGETEKIYGFYTENPDAANPAILGWRPQASPSLIMVVDGTYSMGWFDGGTLIELSVPEGGIQNLGHVASLYGDISPDGGAITFEDGSIYQFDHGWTTFDPTTYGTSYDRIAASSWSPDGNLLAWQMGRYSEVGNFFQVLGIYDLIQDTLTPLHPFEINSDFLMHGWRASSPEWSPDGKWVGTDTSLAFDPEEKGYWLLSSDGAHEYKLGGYAHTWKTDGNWLAYWDATETASEATLFVVPVTVDGIGTPLKIGQQQKPENLSSLSPPLWAPDGNYLTYLDELGQVWVVETTNWTTANVLTLPASSSLLRWTTGMDVNFAALTILPTPVPTSTPQPTPTPIPFVCPKAPRPRVQVGDSARIAFTDGSNVRIRSTPEVAENILIYLTAGTEIEIIGGPVCAPRPDRTDAFVFWEVFIPSENLTGWVAEGDSIEYYIEPWP